MKFGSVPLGEAEGGILAHSVKLPSGVLKKGTRLESGHIASLTEAGLANVSVARLDADDLDEDSAALQIAACLEREHLALGPATTGRVNLIAKTAGLVEIDARAVAAMNAIDEGITLATLSPYARVAKNRLVATVKIIPYAVPAVRVAAATDALGASPIRLAPFRGGTARLVMTATPGFKESLLAKGERVVRDRVEALGYTLNDVVTVAHRTEAVAEALATYADLTLILGASATSDRADVAPAGVVAAGGQLTRFGMPVDPGNLLFLAELHGKPVVGLPGCARSPALNGADWVLERLAAGIEVQGADVAAMGVGGLLKEMPDRPHPRRSGGA